MNPMLERRIEQLEDVQENLFKKIEKLHDLHIENHDDIVTIQNKALEEINERLTSLENTVLAKYADPKSEKFTLEERMDAMEQYIGYRPKKNKGITILNPPYRGKV